MAGTAAESRLGITQHTPDVICASCPIHPHLAQPLRKSRPRMATRIATSFRELSRAVRMCTPTLVSARLIRTHGLMPERPAFRPIKKLLVANRSEIAIRVFRTATELGMRTVAIYTHEDRYALHRFKADEAYEVGQPGEPLRAYLDIDGIVAIAKQYGVDAIHPGYGFLSENPRFAEACDRNGHHIRRPLTEAARTARRQDRCPRRSPGRQGSRSSKAATASAPLKPLRRPLRSSAIRSSSRRRTAAADAACGSSARPRNSRPRSRRRSSESQNAFGSPDVFVEKFIEHARHIEVQLLGDWHGNLVHLWERDCSVQRRHQKVVEIAPAPNLDPKVRQGLCDAAIAIGRAGRLRERRHGRVSRRCRRGQLLLHRGESAHSGRAHRHRGSHRHRHRQLADCSSRRDARSTIPRLVSAISRTSRPPASRCSAASRRKTRRTTFCPTTAASPTIARRAAWASVSMRGSAFSGAVVNPFYDSLLVKVTARGRRFLDAVHEDDPHACRSSASAA